MVYDIHEPSVNIVNHRCMHGLRAQFIKNAVEWWGRGWGLKLSGESTKTGRGGKIRGIFEKYGSTRKGG